MCSPPNGRHAADMICQCSCSVTGMPAQHFARNGLAPVLSASNEQQTRCFSVEGQSSARAHFACMNVFAAATSAVSCCGAPGSWKR